jgi:hypothetical protein
VVLVLKLAEWRLAARCSCVVVRVGSLWRQLQLRWMAGVEAPQQKPVQMVQALHLERKMGCLATWTPALHLEFDSE